MAGSPSFCSAAPPIASCKKPRVRFWSCARSSVNLKYRNRSADSLRPQACLPKRKSPTDFHCPLGRTPCKTALSVYSEVEHEAFGVSHDRVFKVLEIVVLADLLFRVVKILPKKLGAN